MEHISIIFLSVWRNWIARQTSNLKVAGSNPVMDTGFVVKLVITVDFESTVPGSIPGETYFLYSSVGRAPGC